MGHSNFGTTADTYVHTTAAAERTAALALERAIYGALLATVLETENKNSGVDVNERDVNLAAQLATQRRKAASAFSASAAIGCGGWI